MIYGTNLWSFLNLLLENYVENYAKKLRKYLNAAIITRKLTLVNLSNSNGGYDAEQKQVEECRKCNSLYSSNFYIHNALHLIKLCRSPYFHVYTIISHKTHGGKANCNSLYRPGYRA